MSLPHDYKWPAACLSVLAVGLALSAHAQEDTFGGFPGTNALIRIPADSDDWTRHFHLGAIVGWNINAKFGTPGNFGVGGQPGVYGNGYVLPGASGNPNYTANWGYSSSSQYDSLKQTLSFTGANSFSGLGSSQNADGGVQAGLDIAYGGNLYYWKHARVGWDLGFSWLPIDITSHQNLSGTVSSTTYYYDVSGLQGLVPAAPYQGAANGIGRAIPTSSLSNSVASSVGTVSGTQELDVSLYTLRLGPTMYWDLSRRTSLSLGAGPAVGLAWGDYKYNETVTALGVSTPVSGKVSGTDVVFGGYVNATLLYHLQKNGDLFLGAQYMPMTDATIGGGGRSGQLDLSGQVYISVGINWPF